jgi:glutamyl-tRNA synthetase
LELLKPRAKSLDHLVDELQPFLVADDQLELDPAAAGKHLTAEVAPVLLRLAHAVEGNPTMDASSTEQTLRSLAVESNIKAATVIHATRVAVTGRAVSAGLFELLTVMGAGRVVRRLRRAATYTSGG